MQARSKQYNNLPPAVLHSLTIIMNVLAFFGEDASMSESSSQRGDEGAKLTFWTNVVGPSKAKW